MVAITDLHGPAEGPAQRFLRGDRWHSRTYAELDSAILAVARTLVGAGVGPESRVALLAPTRADWTVVDLAILRLGAVVVPLHPMSSSAQTRDLIRRSGARVVVVDPTVARPDDAGLTILTLGVDDGDLGDLASRADDTTPVPTHPSTSDDLATIAFTSGSTGRAKGCLLTHGNQRAAIDAALRRELGERPAPAHRRAAFIYLPLAHASARLQQMTTLAAGGEIVYGRGGTDALMTQIRSSRPTYVAGVPRLFEAIWQRVAGDPQALRDVVGDDLEYALSGGAPISPQVLHDYARAGITLIEGYGLTETATVLTLGALHDHRPGTVGRPIDGVELRVAPDGELLARGANIFAGYLGDPGATADAMDGDWFRTGDLGSIDADGHVSIVGRSKNLLVTSTGKKIAPEWWENGLRARCGVTDALLVGEGRPYLTALVVAPAEDAPRVELGVRSLNDEVSRPERVRTVVLLDEPWSVEDGLVTASGKTVRSAVADAHSSLIDDLYAGRPVDAPVIALPVDDTPSRIPAPHDATGSNARLHPQPEEIA